MKSRSWLFWVIAAIVLITLANVVYMSIGEAPDIYTWTWFGWRFGINWSSYPLLKVIIVVGGYAALHILDQKQLEDELKK